MNFFLKNILLFALIYNLSLESSEVKAKLLNHKYKRIKKICMNLWTKIDLIKAINFTEKQKTDFINNNLIDLLINLHEKTKKLIIKSSGCIETSDFNLSSNDLNYIKSLVFSIYKHMEYAFENIENEESLVAFFLLKKILKILELDPEFVKIQEQNQFQDCLLAYLF